MLTGKLRRYLSEIVVELVKILSQQPTTLDPSLLLRVTRKRP